MYTYVPPCCRRSLAISNRLFITASWRGVIWSSVATSKFTFLGFLSPPTRCRKEVNRINTQVTSSTECEHCINTLGCNHKLYIQGVNTVSINRDNNNTVSVTLTQEMIHSFGRNKIQQFSHNFQMPQVTCFVQRTPSSIVTGVYIHAQE